MAPPEIPEGWTKYDPYVLPPEGAEEIEMMYEDGTKSIRDVSWFGRWSNYNILVDPHNKRIAWRVTKWRKKSDEIWAVVKIKNYPIDKHTKLTFFATKEQAVHSAKQCQKVLAFFKPFETGGKWTEGDGLNLLKE